MGLAEPEGLAAVQLDPRNQGRIVARIDQFQADARATGSRDVKLSIVAL